MRHAEGASAVRSAAQHRSDSAARSTPTLPTQAQRDVGKDTPKNKKMTLRLC
ncbi:MAG: hypothetical protein NZ455_15685 [Bacteroidia bacterium]|nr:hypothetical protein [Bacteroidia bacterium]MDW8347996.1 hypothetical protein [Bacteroidia bacterium]